MANEQFDKDFGYLMPFLDKIAAAASAVADPAAREELARMVAGEKAKWARIRELLSGAKALPAPQASPPDAQTQPGDVAREGFSFTVGSLRTRR